MTLLHDKGYAVANVMLEALCDLLTELEVPPVRCCLAQGTPPPMDPCCITANPTPGGPPLDGFAWIVIGETVPTGVFPNPLETVEKCPQGFAQTYTLGIYRCAPTLHDDGSPPTCDEVTDAVQRQQNDGVILRRAIRCALAAADNAPFVIGTGGPINPRGGCMGYQVNVQVLVEDCIGCAPIAP